MDEEERGEQVKQPSKTEKKISQYKYYFCNLIFIKNIPEKLRLFGIACCCKFLEKDFQVFYLKRNKISNIFIAVLNARLESILFWHGKYAFRTLKPQQLLQDS